MSAQTDSRGNEKGAYGAVFAVAGFLAIAIIYAIQHGLMVFGPVIRNWALGHPLHIAISAYGALVLIAVWGLARFDP